MNVFTRTFNAIGGGLMARSGRVGILGTNGRRSGQRRTAPVGYVLRPDGTIAIGAGGQARAWAANLPATPSCTFSIKGAEGRYRARRLESAERETALVEMTAKIGRPAERASWADVFELVPEA